MSREDERRPQYDPAATECKWQRRWEKRGTNLFTSEELAAAENPYYNLMMFPYPSAEGLHVGNIYAFTGADVHGRYWRMRGKTVFEPMGFDAFGIHSENFAIKVGTHPMDLIPANVRNFKRQLRRIGGMFDWRHQLDTTDPEYYRWTQWLFLRFYEAGLAERKKAPVNWCPSCMTVLANEQVVAEACERCDTLVEQRSIEQWFFRITDYAERLFDNLNEIDWSAKTIKAQRNWIGRSVGAELRFPVMREGPADADPSQVAVYTTRPDTVFGATYMLLSPEHPLANGIASADRRDAVAEYRRRARRKDLQSRRRSGSAKTGVFTGGYCRNPATGRPIPVWIADYVLMDYGTGAIMGVPGHDRRDFEFATEFGLPIVRVVAGPGEDRDTPVGEPYAGEGILVNSGEFDGTPTSESSAKLANWAEREGWGERRVNYRLHDWCISRQRYWGPPIPIIHCYDCGAVPVPDGDLPVLLPHTFDFIPDSSGVAPLARAESWYRAPCPKCGAAARRETDVSDTFLDSGWYFLRYPSTDSALAPFDPELTRKWLPVDAYIGGNEHAVLHLLYARFITMALHDLGYLDVEEPFRVFRAHGLIIAGGSKMSKSRGNVIVPDPIIEEYGADAFRIFLMFLGPFEEGGDYRAEGMAGPHGFLHRLWDAALGAEEGDPDPDVERKVHRTIEQVTRQIPELGYNTAIAALMECLNVVRAGGRRAARSEVEPLVAMVAPFAPHIAEELWERLGHRTGVFDGANWPVYDEAKAVDSVVTIAVQVNGKLRGTVAVPTGATKEEVVRRARTEDNVARHLPDAAEPRVIHVPGRLVNFVVT